MRWLQASLLVLLGCALLVGAWLVPAYLAAVDPAVIRAAGQGTATLPDLAEEHLRMGKPGAARLVGEAALRLNVLGGTAVMERVERLTRASPSAARWGEESAYLDALFGNVQTTAGEPVLELLLSETGRAVALRSLSASRRVDVQTILGNRSLERSVIFPPVGTSSGAALDAAILLTGMLLASDQLSDTLRREVEGLALAANRGLDSTPIEVFYLNLNSLARRTDWGRLTAFLRHVEDVATLRRLVRNATRSDRNLPLVFSAVLMAQSGARIGNHLARFPDVGMADLSTALRSGKGAVNELLRRNVAIHESPVREALAPLPGLSLLHALLVRVGLAAPLMALLLKYVLWFDAAFCLARGIWELRPRGFPGFSALEAGGLNTLRQNIVAALTVFLVATLGEPELTRSPTPVAQAAMWRFPRLKPMLAEQTVTKPPDTMTDSSTWLALGIFFVIQLAIYILCLVRLREVKRQELSSHLKLRLLDNEENLFDSGLYIGLGGTVLSLVLLAVGVIKPSLMVAYASTLFGIFFVSVLKIFHVRNYRRQLIVESEQEIP
jgi:hypothetical protein